MALYDTPPDEIPVAPVEWPERLSQTLMRHENRCPRSAYLYVKHMGKVRSHAMDRGTLAHSCAEMVMVDLIREGESSMLTPDFDVPFDEMDEALSMQTTALVAEVRRDLESRGRVHISAEQADIARICTYHLARGLDVSPDNVLGIERKFVLDLPCGWEISVKGDLLWTPEPGIAVVDDYKTSLHAPADGEWDAFQVKVGALAMAVGYPVETVPCSVCGGEGAIEDLHPLTAAPTTAQTCTVCGGRGKIETRLENIGGAFGRYRGRELYPRLKLQRDGSLQRNTREWTRLELDEFHGDLDAAGARILERLESWVWPARKGSWCNECPAESECPLTRELRDYEGAVNDAAQANELWEWSLAMGSNVSKVQARVKAWAKESGESVRVGDLSWAWVTTNTRAVKRAGKSSDWDGLIEALRRSAELGEKFDVNHWIKTQRKQDFKKTKAPELPAGEVVESVQPDERGADERWGADAPW